MKTQIPTELHEEPAERTPIKYEEICKLIGHLYIDAHVRSQEIKEQSKGAIQALYSQMDAMRSRVKELEEELRKAGTKDMQQADTLEGFLNNGKPKSG